MTVNAYFTRSIGTPIVWGQTGSPGITAGKIISLNALAAGSARMGVFLDLGEFWYEEHIVQLAIESGTAPTPKMAMDLFLPTSIDGSRWPGGVTGSDAAWPSDGNEDEWAAQLSRSYVTSLLSTNDANTLQIGDEVIWVPQNRFVAPVIDNNWDVAIRNQGTPADNLSRLYITPRRFHSQTTV